MVVGSPNPTLLWAIGNYFSSFFPQSWTIDPRTPPPSLMCRTNPLAQLTTGVRTVSVYTNPNWWTPVPSTAEEDSSETSRTAWPRGTLSSNSWVALQERLSSFPEPHAQLCNNNGTVPQPNPPRPGRGHLCRFNGKCGFGGRQCAQRPLWVLPGFSQALCPPKFSQALRQHFKLLFSFFSFIFFLSKVLKHGEFCRPWLGKF